MGSIVRAITKAFRRPWSDDVRVEIRAHNGRCYWYTREYRDQSWSTGPHSRQHGYAPTGRIPVVGGALPHDRGEALAIVAAALEDAGWRAGGWFVNLGTLPVPLGQWLDTCGEWGNYTVVQATITPM
jgi:hypothetical protein